VVTATGTRTKFGRTADLVRAAHVTSSQQKAVLRVVGSLAAVNGCVALVLVGYAHMIGMPLTELLPLVLITIIATIPVALPATFTLATALGAQALAKRGVLPTRLSRSTKRLRRTYFASIRPARLPATSCRSVRYARRRDSTNRGSSYWRRSQARREDTIGSMPRSVPPPHRALLPICPGGQASLTGLKMRRWSCSAAAAGPLK
jgi:hypothetical protein